MRALDLLRFSSSALRGHRLRTLLSLLGVAIGVASVILLTSLGEGARLYVSGEFATLGSNLIIVIPGKTETRGAAPFVNTATHDLTMADADAIARRIPGIVRTAPLALGTSTVSYGDRSRDVTVLGTTYEMRGIRRLDLAVGRFLPPGMRDGPVAVIGAQIQRELFQSKSPLGEMIRLGPYRFRVIGVLMPRGVSIGSNLDEIVEIPVETALRIFNRTSLFRLMAEVRSHRDIENTHRQIIDLLKERHQGVEDVTVMTQDAVLSTFTQILSLLTAALVGIAAISLSVAGIGIMNVMLVSVAERTTEIGLLKAVGVTRAQVVAVFLIEAAIISTAGGILGLAAGVGGGQIIRHLVPEFPIQPPFWATVTALLVSLSVGIFFGAFPARRAARLDPVEALLPRRT